jgi:DeoR/GlpR family transcriptional regulator of sugar metabolism
MFTIKHSEARILVADHSKLDRFAPVITGKLTDVDFLVMDFISAPIRRLCLQLEIEMFETGPVPESAAC